MEHFRTCHPAGTVWQPPGPRFRIALERTFYDPRQRRVNRHSPRQSKARTERLQRIAIRLAVPGRVVHGLQQQLTIMGNLANGRLNADAIRIEHMADIPEIEVLEQGIDMADGAAVVDFGSTMYGVPVSRTFTVRNVGGADLTLSESISLPTGFTLVAGFGSTTLAPDQSTTFTIGVDGQSLGDHTGEISFGNNDDDEGPFNFTVHGIVEAPDAVQIVDNGDAAFAAVGSWTRWVGQGYQDDVHEGFTSTARASPAGRLPTCCPATIKFLQPGPPTRIELPTHRSNCWTSNATHNCGGEPTGRTE